MQHFKWRRAFCARIKKKKKEKEIGTVKSLKSDIKINKKQRRQAFPAVFHLSDLIDHFPCHCDTWKMFQQNHCTNSFCQTTITLMTLQFPSSWLVTNLQKMVTDQGG